MISDIKYFALQYVNLSEGIDDSDKLLAANWITKHTDDEVKSLLMTGGYDYMQESVDMFNNTLGLFLNEAPGGPVTYTSDVPRMGNLAFINMDQLVKKIQSAMQGGYDIGHEIGQKAGETIGHAKGLAQGQSQGVKAGLAAAAVAALVATVAYKTYKRFFSTAAKTCSMFKGMDKTNCMNKIKKEAKMKQIADLTKGKQACKNTKTPSKCISKIDKKIGKLKASLGEL